MYFVAQKSFPQIFQNDALVADITAKLVAVTSVL
jgi:hypothetical protein